MPLPTQVIRFFEEVGPVDVAVRGLTNDIFFPSLARLWPFQAGYRWNSVTGQPIASWPDPWFVVASVGGDPFIYASDDDRVLYAMHGMGSWESADAVFGDLSTLAISASVLGDVLNTAKNVLDSEGVEVTEQGLATAQDALMATLQDADLVGLALCTFGWQ